MTKSSNETWKWLNKIRYSLVKISPGFFHLVFSLSQITFEGLIFIQESVILLVQLVVILFGSVEPCFNLDSLILFTLHFLWQLLYLLLEVVLLFLELLFELSDVFALLFALWACIDESFLQFLCGISLLTEFPFELLNLLACFSFIWRKRRFDVWDFNL